MSEDPRQIRTRVALTEALLRLLEDESLSSISVAALCQAAGVHRTTFYKHSSGIEEFAVEVITRELDTVSTVNARHDDGIDFDAYGRAMIDVLEHVAGERALYRPLLASKWAGALRVAIDERMQQRVRIALEVFAADEKVAVPEDREHVVAFVTGAIVGTIVRWALIDETDAATWAARTQALMPSWWPVR